MLENSKKYIKREVFDEIAAHLEKPEITLITGSRQVGKTVLLEQLKAYLIEEKRISQDSIFYFNIDIIQDWEFFQNQANFIEFLKDRSKKQKIYVFVDEAQKVSEAAVFFKGVYDSKLNVKLILTGSSSLEIKAKFKETLAGRKMVFMVSSFSFLEFLTAKDKILAEYIFAKQKLTEIDKKKVIEFYKEYLIFGGYPRVVLSDSREEKISVLQEIYSSYIEQDAINFLGIENKTAFIKLVKLLSAQVGQLVKIEELALNLNISRETVERYVLALEETFIIKKITPYFKNPRQEIVKAGKIYFNDLGIRNLALENFNILDERIDKGQILENGVFIELQFLYRNKMAQIHFWRTKQKTEVDFAIEKGLEITPVEVKYNSKNIFIPIGLKNFILKFSPKKSFIVSFFTDNGVETKEGTRVNFIYPFEIYKIMEE